MHVATASKITAMICLALLLAAALFAWVRSRQQPTLSAVSTPEPREMLAVGRSVYAEECGFCHGGDATDRSSLARQVDDTYGSGSGTADLVDFLLFGIEATTDDELDHPPFDHLTDVRIAALLEYLLAYGPSEETAGGRPPISSNDVAARRVAR